MIYSFGRFQTPYVKSLTLARVIPKTLVPQRDRVSCRGADSPIGSTDMLTRFKFCKNDC
jgi:hypothetical protein